MKLAQPCLVTTIAPQPLPRRAALRLKVPPEPNVSSKPLAVCQPRGAKRATAGFFRPPNGSHQPRASGG